MQIPTSAKTNEAERVALDMGTSDRTGSEVVIPIGFVSPRDAGRLAEIILTLARHGVGIAIERGAFVVVNPVDRAPKAVSVALRRSFESLGPTFVKLGQFIASSPGLFPETLSVECSKLLENVAPEPPQHVRRVIELSYGSRLEDVFSEFSFEPEAAASISQVHRARLVDGRSVAVKIRRPRLRSRIEQDLRILDLVAFALQRAGAIGAAVNPKAIVDDFATTLKSELDLRKEAANMVEFSRNLRSNNRHPDVVVPEPFLELNTERILVMTFVEGRSVAEIVSSRHSVDHPQTGHYRTPIEDIDFERLLRAGVRAWFESVFVHGFFHGDVHAGNLFVTPDRKVALLDFGIMGRLDEPYRIALAAAIRSLLGSSDISRVVRSLVELGATSRPIDVDAVASDIEALTKPLLDRPLAEISYGEVLSKLLQVATRHKLHLPKQLVLVAKQLLYFERYAKTVAPEYKILADKQLWEL